jgi:hypothetical protein
MVRGAGSVVQVSREPFPAPFCVQLFSSHDEDIMRDGYCAKQRCGRANVAGMHRLHDVAKRRGYSAYGVYAGCSDFVLVARFGKASNPGSV